jgi:hypothetical protein
LQFVQRHSHIGLERRIIANCRFDKKRHDTKVSDYRTQHLTSTCSADHSITLDRYLYVLFFFTLFSSWVLLLILSEPNPHYTSTHGKSHTTRPQSYILSSSDTNNYCRDNIIKNKYNYINKDNDNDNNRLSHIYRCVNG